MYSTKKTARNVVIVSVAACLVLSGCANKRSADGGKQPAPTASSSTAHSASIRVSDETTRSGVPVYRENGLVWVPLQEAAESMGFHLHAENDSLAMGETDAAYTAKVNDTQAMVGDSPVNLPQAPRLFNGKPYMTTEALSSWVGTPVNWSEADSHVVITPADDASSSAPMHAQSSPSPDAGMDQSFHGLAASAANKAEVVRYAQRFMGTPYQFAAKSYDQTHKFDCSSFVQYVYGHFGVRLPRSSRSQSQVGQTVKADQLQIGDIMFFYTPGRFSSNRIVGHVGIYAGNGKIVHTYGRPGVTVTDFSGNWRRRFLWAKRV